MRKCSCWRGYRRVPGSKPCSPGSCVRVKAVRRLAKGK